VGLAACVHSDHIADSCRQAEHRRRHLGNVNFARLDIFEPGYVDDLTYDQEGRPKRLREVKAAKWAEQVTAIKQETTESLAGLAHFSEECKTFQELSRLPVGRDALLLGAQQLLEIASLAEHKAVKAVHSAQDARMDMALFIESVRMTMPEEAQDEPLRLGNLADTSTGAADTSASASSSTHDVESEPDEPDADAESEAEEEVYMD
jgi:hypothetical protein